MMSEEPHESVLRSPGPSQSSAITWEDFDGKAVTNITSPRSWQVRGALTRHVLDRRSVRPSDAQFLSQETRAV